MHPNLATGTQRLLSAHAKCMVVRRLTITGELSARESSNHPNRRSPRCGMDGSSGSAWFVCRLRGELPVEPAPWRTPRAKALLEERPEAVVEQVVLAVAHYYGLSPCDLMQNKETMGVAANSGVDSGLDKREQQPGRAEGKEELIRDILASSPRAAEILRPHFRPRAVS